MRSKVLVFQKYALGGVSRHSRGGCSSMLAAPLTKRAQAQMVHVASRATDGSTGACALMSGGTGLPCSPGRSMTPPHRCPMEPHDSMKPQFYPSQGLLFACLGPTTAVVRDNSVSDMDWAVQQKLTTPVDVLASAISIRVGSCIASALHCHQSDSSQHTRGNGSGKSPWGGCEASWCGE